MQTRQLTKSKDFDIIRPSTKSKGEDKMDKMKKLEELVYLATDDDSQQQEIMDLVKKIIEDTKVETRVEVLKAHRLI